MSLFSVLIALVFLGWVGYIAIHYRLATRQADSVLPTRNPGESFADWADGALAVFDDEDEAREYAAHRELISRTADWIRDITCDQFNAAVVRHLDTPSR